MAGKAGGAPQGGSAGTADASAEDTGVGPSDASVETSSADAATDAPIVAKQCLNSQYLDPSKALAVDYDQYHPVIGTHCKGTNHQDIKDVQRVLFLGDSVTVGTPPTNIDPGAVYRSILAKKLASLLNVAPPGPAWGAADPLNGIALPAESGAFVSCAKWGARTDDLLATNHQIEDCIPQDKKLLHHLVIMTVGGNDIDSITSAGGGANPAKTIPELWQQAQDFVLLMQQAVEWLKDPVNVPGGVDVVFANLHEFTDGTADVTSCPGASLAGIEPWQDTQAQKDIMIWANEQYLKIAVDTGSDMVFMLEAFCGHGFKRNDPTGPCYRGPNQPIYLDASCVHPNADGHAALADLFYETIAE